MKIHRSFLVIALIIIPVVFSGCSSVNTSEDLILDDSFFDQAQPLETTTISLDAVTVEQSHQGSYSFSEADQLVIQHENDFEILWNKLHEHSSSVPELPEINFEDFSVIAVMMGVQSTGGFSIEITKVSLLDDIIGIKINEREPGNCIVAEVLTSPYHIVKIPKQTGINFEFKVERKLFDCE